MQKRPLNHHHDKTFSGSTWSNKVKETMPPGYHLDSAKAIFSAIMAAKPDIFSENQQYIDHLQRIAEAEDERKLMATRAVAAAEERRLEQAKIAHAQAQIIALNTPPPPHGGGGGGNGGGSHGGSGGMNTTNVSKVLNAYRPFDLSSQDSIATSLYGFISQTIIDHLTYEQCTQALLKSLHKYPALHQQCESMHDSLSGTAEFKFKAVFKCARAVMLKKNQEALPLLDSEFITTFRLRPGQNISSAIGQFTRWHRLMKCTYSEQEMKEICKNQTFEVAAAERLNDAVLMNPTTELTHQVRKHRRNWDEWAKEFAAQDIAIDGDDTPITPANTMTLGGHASAGDGAEPMYAVDGRSGGGYGKGSISDEAAAKTAAALQPYFEKLIKVLDRLELMVQMGVEASKEAAQGQLILREVITTLRNNTGVDWNAGNSTVQQAQALEQRAIQAFGSAGLPAAPHAASARPLPGKRAPWFNKRSSGTVPAPQMTPEERVKQRMDVLLSELPEPWQQALKILLNGKKFTDDICCICPEGKGIPHPTSKCGFLFLLTRRGQEWLKARVPRTAMPPPHSPSASRHWTATDGVQRSPITTQRCASCAARMRTTRTTSTPPVTLSLHTTTLSGMTRRPAMPCLRCRGPWRPDTFQRQRSMRTPQAPIRWMAGCHLNTNLHVTVPRAMPLTRQEGRKGRD
ncbi:hypothetical protein OAO87_00715 [bacterium]|nr:hypothetical protein [bacterium]